MAALDAACVAAGSHLFAAEAGGEGDVPNRQRGAVEDLLSIEVRDRHLGGRDEPEVLLGVAVEIVAELGQVAGADQALAPDHIGRVDLDVAVLGRMQIQHIGDERALQARAPALQNVEARAGHLDAALEVDDVVPGPEVPVRLRLEGVGSLLALLAHDSVFGLVLADRHRRVGEVGQLQELRFEDRLGSGELAGHSLDALLEGQAGRLRLFARLAGGGAADLLGQAILLRLQGLGFVLQIAHARVLGHHAIEVDGAAQPLVGGADLFGLLSQQPDVNHDGEFTRARRCRQQAYGRSGPRPGRRAAGAPPLILAIDSLARP